jgi:hypothetical protein
VLLSEPSPYSNTNDIQLSLSKHIIRPWEEIINNKNITDIRYEKEVTLHILDYTKSIEFQIVGMLKESSHSPILVQETCNSKEPLWMDGLLVMVITIQEDISVIPNNFHLGIDTSCSGQISSSQLVPNMGEQHQQLKFRLPVFKSHQSNSKKRA